MNSDLQVTAQMNAPGSSLFNFNTFSEVMEAAKLLASSNIVPETYQSWPAKTTGFNKRMTQRHTEVLTNSGLIRRSNREEGSGFIYVRNIEFINE